MVRTPTGQRIIAALRDGEPTAGAPPSEVPLDGWLRSLFAEELDAIETSLGGSAGPESYALFRDLDDDLWALLLTREYSSHPRILDLLPGVPEQQLQLNWNGAHGLKLATQSRAFYRHVKDRLAADSDVALADATILDYGCGWGRLTRFFARDVEPGALLACDPVESILDVCRELRVPAELARSEFVPEELPFDRGIDLAYSFSVFTHISEEAAWASLQAIHSALNPGGLLVLTIRPPAYLDYDPKMHEARDALGPDPLLALAAPHYVFVPHPHDPSHPQYETEAMSYGETVISLPYIRERWSDLFKLTDVKAIPEDIYQVAVTLKKR